MKKIILFLLLAILATEAYLLSSKQFKDLNQKLPIIGKEFVSELADKIEKEISIPPPLISKKKPLQSFLTVEGVLKWTNSQRKENGSLPPLKENKKLDAIAEERMKDMFEKQYFEHNSPEGINASNIAEKNGYQFIAIGENLALGNFQDDKALVQAWMDSPGHRANILNNRYQELGVAVGKGIYEGEQTWIGVQIFALPLSACPQPDKALKTNIDALQSEIAGIEKNADILKNEIGDLNAETKEEIDIYNQKVGQYNTMIEKANELIAQAKIAIAAYNKEVNLLNSCIKK